MSYILILWVSMPWQVGGTGTGGTALATATFVDQAACQAAGSGAQKYNKYVGFICAPSASH